MSDILFTTIHGSRLYGLNHELSDRDSVIVYLDKRRARHKNGTHQDDVIHVGVADLLEKAFSGAHQFVETVFSEKKEYHNTDWKPMFDNFRVPVSAVREKYMRTIKAFTFADTQKSRQHAVRLGVALRYLRINDGRYNPSLSEEDIQLVKTTALMYHEEQLLVEIEGIVYG